MKMFKHRNLMSIIYCMLLALPLCSILGRVLYVQWNKNAKDSYSDYSDYEMVKLTNYTQLESGKDYYLTKGTGMSCIYIFNDSSFNNAGQTQPGTNGYRFYVNANNESLIYYYIYDEALDTLTQNGNTAYGAFDNITIKINLNKVKANSGSYALGCNVSTIFSTEGTLDNAFSYSVNEIIKDNNFGEINFVGLFDDLFLDQTNSANSLYLNFANWYMNYALFISLVYILFLVLMWFINFIRKILEKGMDFGQRGY